jgi:hypothetical protein
MYNLEVVKWLKRCWEEKLLVLWLPVLVLAGIGMAYGLPLIFPTLKDCHGGSLGICFGDWSFGVLAVMLLPSFVIPINGPVHVFIFYGLIGLTVDLLVRVFPKLKVLRKVLFWLVLAVWFLLFVVSAIFY